MDDKIIERFHTRYKAGEPDECWLWTAASDGEYGQFRMGDRKLLAHRVAYTLAFGPIPNGLCVLHHCDVRRCVNPAHHFLGTKGDNNRDRHKKGRTASGTHIKQSKLNPNIVQSLRERYAAGDVSQRKLAAEYGVTQACIGYIIRRKTWRHVA